MKKFLFISTFVFSFLLTLIAQETPPPDWIKQFDGIPIHAGLPEEWIDYPGALDSMKQAGINIVTTDMVEPQEIVKVIDTSFKVIGLRSEVESEIVNDIQYYTDAKYSLWEAEGIDTAYGDAKLYYDSTVTDVINNGDTLKYLKLKSSKAGLVDTLIWGPYYTQDVTYYTMPGTISEWDTVYYTADFRMKLELNPGYSDIVHPDTPLCIIQVTQSYNISLYELGCTYVIKQYTITRGEFTQLNQFDIYPIDRYDLKCDSCRSRPESQSPPPQYSFPSRIDEEFPSRKASEYIQFKVIWLGKPQYLLSIDKVTVSDERGRRLINPDSVAVDQILAQADSWNGYINYITGWVGVDERLTYSNLSVLLRNYLITIANGSVLYGFPGWDAGVEHGKIH